MYTCTRLVAASLFSAYALYAAYAPAISALTVQRYSNSTALCACTDESAAAANAHTALELIGTIVFTGESFHGEAGWLLHG
jgi:Flp pilus assembly protein TadG